MDRRSSLKLIATGAIASGAIATGCNPAEEKKPAEAKAPEFQLDRYPEELAHEKAVLSQGKFFSEHEMATITILADIIIPKDDVSGSATDAKVPEWIDFIVRDMPQHALPMRGGLRWVDMTCFKLYNQPFTGCTAEQRIQLVDEIAYPNKTKPEYKPGESFFTLMRNLTMSGFYSSEIGVKDIGYVGNTPNQWNGVPDEVLRQYNLAYTDKEMAECVSFSKA